MSRTAGHPAGRPAPAPMTVPRAVSLGVGSMVGAGIFALLGEVAAVATSGVWIAFAIGGVVALLNGYSYGRLGARYPSAGGPVDYLTRGFGVGVFSGGLSIFYYAAGVIGMSMVARAFATYAGSLLPGSSPSNTTVGIFAACLVVVLTLVNFIGSDAVGKVELWVVAAKLTVLAIFVVGGATGIRAQLFGEEFTVASPGGLLGAVGLAFFAYTGFGIVTNTAAEMAHPERELPRALWIAIGIVIALYLSIALVTFGSLSIADVIADKDTALAIAAEPVFGRAGFTVMAVAAMLATASAVNASLYGSSNISYVLAKQGELPEDFDRRVWHRAPEGLFITAGMVIAFASFLDLSQVAALGSLASLLVYIAVSAGHFRLRAETGARATLLAAALASTGATIVAFTIRLASRQPFVLASGIGVLAGCFVIEAVLQRKRSIHPDAGVD